ncbi:unnamed protein product, partial [Choristocarpus tenellus]
MATKSEPGWGAEKRPWNEEQAGFPLDPRHLLSKLKVLHKEAKKKYGVDLVTVYLGEGGRINTIVSRKDAVVTKVMMDETVRSRQQAIVDSFRLQSNNNNNNETMSGIEVGGDGVAVGEVEHHPHGHTNKFLRVTDRSTSPIETGMSGYREQATRTPKRQRTVTVPLPSTNKGLAEFIRQVLGLRPLYGNEAARPCFWPDDVPWQKGKSISQMNNTYLQSLARAALKHQAQAASELAA